MKKKLKLRDLKVGSFVTTLQETNETTVKGGTGSIPTGKLCAPTIPLYCQPTAIQGVCSVAIC